MYYIAPDDHDVDEPISHQPHSTNSTTVNGSHGNNSQDELGLRPISPITLQIRKEI